jgi:hypothetical protein
VGWGASSSATQALRRVRFVVLRHHTDVDAHWLSGVLNGMGDVHSYVETANVRLVGPLWHLNPGVCAWLSVMCGACGAWLRSMKEIESSHTYHCPALMSGLCHHQRGDDAVGGRLPPAPQVHRHHGGSAHVRVVDRPAMSERLDRYMHPRLREHPCTPHHWRVSWR